jgi:hypothetical protein
MPWIQGLHEDLDTMKKSINLPRLALTFGDIPTCEDIHYLLSVLLTKSHKLRNLNRRFSRKQSIMAPTPEAISRHRREQLEIAAKRAADSLSNEESETINAAVILVKMSFGFIMNDPIPPTPPTSQKRKHTTENDTEEEGAPSLKRQRISKNENVAMNVAASLQKREDAPEEKPDAQKPTKRSTRTPSDASETSSKTRNSKGDATIKTEEDRILHNVRDALTARSKEKADYEAFQDAIFPDNAPTVILPEFTEEEEEKMKKPSSKPLTKAPKGTPPRRLGDPGDLHPSEAALCDRVGLEYDSYRCQKSRIFLAIAICTDFYDRKLRQQPSFKARNIGVSQAQVFCNIDVNITSSLMRAFQFWGWVPTLVLKHPDRKGCFMVSKDCLDRFPREYRRGLLQEVANWEVEMEKPFTAENVLP